MLSLLAWSVALPIALALLYLALELVAGLFPLRHKAALGTQEVPHALLVPAHDEAASIAATVEALLTAAPGARILVVADNCRDATASLARAAGAEVAERNDPLRRGKGYALAFGRDHLVAAPPAAVIVLDADCRIAPGSAARLAAAALRRGGPVQAANLLVAPTGASPLVAISNFAMLVKNLVRARGLVRLGGGALLFGTGMAFPWSQFRALPLASANMVEDLELGLHLARSGVAVALDDAALVTSPAASAANSRGQRSRWEHGFLDTARRQAWPLLAQGLRKRSRHLAVLGAHLLVPPLALLMLAALGALALAGLLGVLAENFLPVLCLGGLLGAVALLLAAVWYREARGLLPWTALVRAPLYMVWKIPIYLAFFTRRRTDWQRTGRDPP